MTDQKEKNDSGDYNQIAIDQMGLTQEMIPEETPHTPVIRRRRGRKRKTGNNSNAKRLRKFRDRKQTELGR